MSKYDKEKHQRVLRELVNCKECGKEYEADGVKDFVQMNVLKKYSKRINEATKNDESHTKKFSKGILVKNYSIFDIS